MTLNEYMLGCHAAALNAGWWKTASLDRDIAKLEEATKVALIHSELSEMLEGMRKGLQDDHLPHRSMAEVECADALIRIFDLAGRLGFDLDGAVLEKLQYNKTRADHKPENRAKAGGKAF